MTTTKVPDISAQPSSLPLPSEGRGVHTRVLHLEDNDHDAELVRRTLADDGIHVEVTRVMKRQTFTDALEEGAFDLILSDYSMPGFDGGSALALAHERCPETPFVFVSGTLGEQAAIQSLK